MLKLKYNDLTNSTTLTFKTFNRHYESFERREQQIAREKEIICGLTTEMEKLGEITYDQYNAVIAWMIHSDKPWYEIMELVFGEE